MASWGHPNLRPEEVEALRSPSTFEVTPGVSFGTSMAEIIHLRLQPTSAEASIRTTGRRSEGKTTLRLLTSLDISIERVCAFK